jgi:hypothetical protein
MPQPPPAPPSPILHGTDEQARGAGFIILSWAPVANATSYSLRISAGGVDHAVSNAVSGATILAFDGNVAVRPMTEYDVRLSYTLQGQKSSESAPLLLVTRPVAAVPPTSPATGITPGFVASVQNLTNVPGLITEVGVFDSDRQTFVVLRASPDQRVSVMLPPSGGKAGPQFAARVVMPSNRAPNGRNESVWSSAKPADNFCFPHYKEPLNMQKRIESKVWNSVRRI